MLDARAPRGPARHRVARALRAAPSEALGRRSAGPGALELRPLGARGAGGELDLEGERHAMARDSDGFWRATRRAAADAPYALVVDGQPTPDPLARAQMGFDLWAPRASWTPAATPGPANGAAAPGRRR
jgi:hypothetical protein